VETVRDRQVQCIHHNLHPSTNADNQILRWNLLTCDLVVACPVCLHYRVIPCPVGRMPLAHVSSAEYLWVITLPSKERCSYLPRGKASQYTLSVRGISPRAFEFNAERDARAGAVLLAAK